MLVVCPAATHSWRLAWSANANPQGGTAMGRPCVPLAERAFPGVALCLRLYQGQYSSSSERGPGDGLWRGLESRAWQSVYRLYAFRHTHSC